MEAECLYHWLKHFFDTNPKTIWDKNEIINAIKEQYIELLNDQAAKNKER